jgi:hypothetical protein
MEFAAQIIKHLLVALYTCYYAYKNTEKSRKKSLFAFAGWMHPLTALRLGRSPTIGAGRISKALTQEVSPWGVVFAQGLG